MATKSGAGTIRIESIPAANLTYGTFCQHMHDNIPVVLTSVLEGWPHFARWQQNGITDTTYIREAYGHRTVPVVECGGGQYGEQKRSTMLLSDYLDKVEGAGVDDVLGGLYLKDWHFQREALGADWGSQAPPHSPYKSPPHFRDDWLNWWCDSQGGGGGRKWDDYRFVYMGPRGTFTPLHHDVLCSYSWSINISGSKEWTLFPPEETHKLYDSTGQGLAEDCREGCYDLIKYPLLSEARRAIVVQGPGEAIFVPSGWHHQVLNSGDAAGGVTISVNHNWFNAFSLQRVWTFLEAELRAVRSSIEHLQAEMALDGDGLEWERQCELIMKANSAMNMSEFCALLVKKQDELLHELEGFNTSVAPSRQCTESTSTERWHHSSSRLDTAWAGGRHGPVHSGHALREFQPVCDGGATELTDSGWRVVCRSAAATSPPATPACAAPGCGQLCVSRQSRDDAARCPEVGANAEDTAHTACAVCRHQIAAGATGTAMVIRLSTAAALLSDRPLDCTPSFDWNCPTCQVCFALVAIRAVLDQTTSEPVCRHIFPPVTS